MQRDGVRLLLLLLVAGGVLVGIALASGRQSASAKPVTAGTLSDLGTHTVSPGGLLAGPVTADISACSQFTLFATADPGDDPDDYISVSGWLATAGQIFETPGAFSDGNHTAFVGFTQQSIFTSDATAPVVSAILFNHNEEPRDIHVSLWCEPY